MGLSLQLTSIILTPLIFFIIWQVTIMMTPPPSADHFSHKRILLVIAHPDDESMFFSPVIQSLTSPRLKNHLKILCLSTGDSEGLGETRRKELVHAAIMLGLRNEEDIIVLNDPRFRDGMKENWDPAEVANVIEDTITGRVSATSDTEKSASSPPTSSSTNSTTARSTQSTKSKPDSQAPTPLSLSTSTIDILITFDESGISSHPNHISVHHGTKLFINKLKSQTQTTTSQTQPTIQLYTLPTVSLLRKYISIFDIIPIFITQQTSNEIVSRNDLPTNTPEKMVFVNTPEKYMVARKAMIQGHKSQMVWFRYGWITLGRYMVLNELRREG